jgi:hypothetical protein
VMLRYVDVEPERTLTFDGRRVQAIAVHERLGLEGSVTTHYMTADGRYLGSVNEDSRITVLPTDADTLERIWTTPDLTRPEAIQPR